MTNAVLESIAPTEQWLEGQGGKLFTRHRVPSAILVLATAGLRRLISSHQFSPPRTSRRKFMLAYKSAILAVVAGLAASTATTQSAPDNAAHSVNVPVEQLRFYQNGDGLTFANVWGDPAKGPHSNYIKLPGSYASPLHVHTSSYYGVVISGVVANQRPKQADQPLAPGSYWFQKGGEQHATKCLSQSECLIFVTSQGRFDIHPVADPAQQAEASKLRK
jgi:beta-alanine degradation protein BauB